MGPCIYAHGSGLHQWKAVRPPLHLGTPREGEKGVQMLQNTRKSIEMWHKLAAKTPAPLH